MCTYRSAHSRYVYWATDTYIDLICVYLSINDANDMAINPTPKMWQQVTIISVLVCVDVSILIVVSSCNSTSLSHFEMLRLYSCKIDYYRCQ